jgi:AraC-like DNA-binding protein
MFDGFMFKSDYYRRYPHLIGVVWPVIFIYWPFFYFYVRELTVSKQIDFSWKQYLNFLPAIVSVLLFIPFYSMSADEKKLNWANCCAHMIVPLDQMSVSSVKSAILMAMPLDIVYAVLSFRLITAYNLKIKQSFSSLEKVSLFWLQTLLLVSCFISFFIFFVAFSAPLGLLNTDHEILSFLFYVGPFIFTYVIAFKTILQPEIFSRIKAAHQAELIRTEQVMVPAVPVPAPDQQDGFASLSREKYQKSWLTNERMAEITDQLLQLMATERPFLEPELTLPQLADRLSISPHRLSQVINRKMNRSFFVLINEYRVQEAKRLLISPQHDHLSILGIALDAGFNSKTTFNTAFVKYTGTTPSKFRIQQESARQGATQNVVGRA